MLHVCNTCGKTHFLLVAKTVYTFGFAKHIRRHGWRISWTLQFRQKTKKQHARNSSV